MVQNHRKRIILAIFDHFDQKITIFRSYIQFHFLAGHVKPARTVKMIKNGHFRDFGHLAHPAHFPPKRQNRVHCTIFVQSSHKYGHPIRPKLPRPSFGRIDQITRGHENPPSNPNIAENPVFGVWQDRESEGGRVLTKCAKSRKWPKIGQNHLFSSKNGCAGNQNVRKSGNFGHVITF